MVSIQVTRVFIAIALFAGLPISVMSQEQQKLPTVSSIGAVEARGTEASPLAEKIIPPTGTQSEAAQKIEWHQEQAKQDSTMAWATIWLAFVTTCLAVFTFCLWRSTSALVKRTGDDSKTIERAYLFVEVLIEENLHASATESANEIQVLIWNHGKTPAEIVQIRAYPLLEDSPPQELIEYPGSERTIPPGLGIAQNNSFNIPPVTVQISKADLNGIYSMSKTLYCVGQIKYRDVFDAERDTGFCWFYRYHKQEGKFVIAPNSQLNKRT